MGTFESPHSARGTRKFREPADWKVCATSCATEDSRSVHSFGDRPAGLVAGAFDLVKNPAVGLFQAVPQPNAGRPAQIFLDQGVVAVATVYSFGRLQIIAPLELHPGDIFDEIHQLID